MRRIFLDLPTQPFQLLNLALESPMVSRMISSETALEVQVLQRCANLPTYFIRHGEIMGIDEDLRDRLWKEHRVGIHFPRDKSNGYGQNGPDSQSTNPDDYAKADGLRPMRFLNRLAKEGGYVCSQHHGKQGYLLGKVLPGSTIEIIKGKWGMRYPEANGRPTFMKTLRLEQARTVGSLEHVVLHVGHPRMGTINPWNLGAAKVRSLVEGYELKPEISSLTPPQQEAMCAEALRIPNYNGSKTPQLISALLPVGGTMKGIDISGLASDGRPLLAQVTYRTKEGSSEKLSALKAIGTGTGAHLLFICRAEGESEEDGVLIVPIQRVFSEFASSDVGKQWLGASLGTK
jgi:hypothetical protein